MSDEHSENKIIMCENSVVGLEEQLVTDTDDIQWEVIDEVWDENETELADSEGVNGKSAYENQKDGVDANSQVECQENEWLCFDEVRHMRHKSRVEHTKHDNEWLCFDKTGVKRRNKHNDRSIGTVKSTHNSQSGKLPCQSSGCRERFKHVTDLRDHARRKHNRMICDRPGCFQIFKDRRSLCKHQYKEKHWTCCSIILHSHPGELEAHMKSRHKLSVMCGVCCLTLANVDVLKRHMRMKHGISNTDKCDWPHCFRLFTNKRRLHQHQYEEKHWTCCSIILRNNPKELERHVMSRHTLSVMCKVCYMTLANPDVLKHHMEQTHGRSAKVTTTEESDTVSSRRTTCNWPDCSHTPSNERNLRKHQHEEKHWICCSIVLRDDPEKLQQHVINKHKLSVMCEVCCFTFADQDILQHHLKTKHLTTPVKQGTTTVKQDTKQDI